jgi:hypothetical protein
VIAFEISMRCICEVVGSVGACRYRPHVTDSLVAEAVMARYMVARYGSTFHAGLAGGAGLAGRGRRHLVGGLPVGLGDLAFGIVPG